MYHTTHKLDFTPRHPHEPRSASRRHPAHYRSHYRSGRCTSVHRFCPQALSGATQCHTCSRDGGSMPGWAPTPLQTSLPSIQLRSTAHARDSPYGHVSLSGPLTWETPCVGGVFQCPSLCFRLISHWSGPISTPSETLTTTGVVWLSREAVIPRLCVAPIRWSSPSSRCWSVQAKAKA